MAVLAIGIGLSVRRDAHAQDKGKPEETKPEPKSLKPGEIQLTAEQEKALDLRFVKAELKRGDHPITIGGKISLDLEKTARVRPLLNSTIFEVVKRAGEDVKKGDVILVVESTDLGDAKNNYLTALANLEVTAETYRREALLRAKRATTDTDFQNARATFRQAAVAVQAARGKCLLLGVQPKELKDLRAELDAEVLEFLNERLGPNVETSLGLRIDGIADLSTEAITVRAASEKDRVQDARIALVEIAKRLADPELARETDGRRRARYSIRAPIDGVVISKDAARGEFVDPSQIIATVADTSDVWINLDIYQKQISKVKTGAAVDVTTPAYPDTAFVGSVTFMAACIDDASHTLKARVVVDNKDRLLKSGMATRCVVHCVDQEPKLELPATAIIRDAGRTFAIVQLGPGHYQRRDVKLSLETDTVVHVDEGIKPDETVVLEGNLYIHTKLPLGD